ncbi:hypothetical protein WQ54_20935 [Bacillus sp. SA1-12]|uniref:gamma-glutamylcyclotransferase n=1 Tax=Bacillus sp. SA1-12 TaxID=1455638 RepID=UPI000627048F|nr:gamma-glutamylcyclotransferase family protein [Bacillus sp. SA1-12]KKI90423.1 hypothetical protein WQ54_20935 [Bacillus sp. SA1-12]
MNSRYKVFVYGTLREHESNHYFLKEASFLARQCWTYGVLYETGLGYPAMIPSKDKKVYGELYEVNAKQLKEIDLFEGYFGDGRKNLYNRITQPVYTEKECVEAFVYVLPASDKEELQGIESGDWKCHQFLKHEKLLYFAYGSCMDHERFELAGVGHLFTKIVGCGTAENYSLAYTHKAIDGGRADLVESNQLVQGKVFEINQEAIIYLYKREGVKSCMYRPAFIPIQINGEVVKNVLVFLVVEKAEEIAPPDHYAREILRGAKGIVSKTYYKKLEEELFKKFQLKITL